MVVIKKPSIHTSTVISTFLHFLQLVSYRVWKKTILLGRVILWLLWGSGYTKTGNKIRRNDRTAGAKTNFACYYARLGYYTCKAIYLLSTYISFDYVIYLYRFSINMWSRDLHHTIVMIKFCHVGRDEGTEYRNCWELHKTHRKLFSYLHRTEKYERGRTGKLSWAHIDFLNVTCKVENSFYQTTFVLLFRTVLLGKKIRKERYIFQWFVCFTARVSFSVRGENCLLGMHFAESTQHFNAIPIAWKHVQIPTHTA